VLALRSSGPFVVEVVRVNIAKPLAEFRVWLNVTGAGQSPVNVNIDPLAVGTWGPGDILAFADSDGNGELSSGDTFTIQPQTNYTSYRLLILHFSAFVNPQPPCPCAAARIVFP